MAQDVEALGIGLHEAVLDAVVDHLHEMAGAARAGMDVALLRPWVAVLASRRARDFADARRERAEDRVEPIDGLLVAADHHAVAALQPPYAAGCADIDVVDPLRVEVAGTSHVVLIERVATVDDAVVGAQEAAERPHRLLGDLPGRKHHPGGSGRFKLGDEIFEARGGGRTFGGQRLHHLRIAVVDHGRVAVAQKTANDVAAHPAEADHAELHPVALPSGPSGPAARSVRFMDRIVRAAATPGNGRA